MTDQAQNDTPTSREEKFFGVSHTIVPRKSDVVKDDDKGKETISVETADDDENSASQKPTTDNKSVATKPDGDQSDDDELAHVSKRVQERINKLTWRAKEAERQREALKAERDEAFGVTRNLYQRTQQMEQLIQSGEGELINRIKTGAETALNAAKAAFKQAYEEGNTDGVIEAQEKMLQAQAEVNEALRSERDYQWRMQQAQQQHQYRQQFPQQQVAQPAPKQQAQNKPDPEAQAWAEKNPWFGFGDKQEHRVDMTALAMAKHEEMKKAGVEINSDEYYDTLDREVRLRFPEYFAGDGRGTTSNQQGRPTNVVAPATRTVGGNMNTRTVKLKPSQVKLARKLGISPEQYAAELLKAGGNQ